MKREIVALVGTFWLMSAALSSEIGFFSPDGVHKEFAGKVDFAIINAGDLAELKRSIVLAESTGTKVFVDFGPVVGRSADPASLSIEYVSRKGERRAKSFAPLTSNKIRYLLPDQEFRSAMQPYAKILAAHRSALAGVYLIDEPYLNGVSREELERAARLTHSIFHEHGIADLKIGVTFAAAMFNADFARHVERAAYEYVEGIDDYRGRIAGTAEAEAWETLMRKARLTTYDSAGNMTTTGGIPAGIDIVSFDFYASTLLFDGLYDRALSWFADNVPNAPCGRFKDARITDLRSDLSFFNNGPVAAGTDAIEADKKLLDAMFDCRTAATLSLLKREIADTPSRVEVILIGESSTNGILEFDAGGNVESGQPEKLVELRMLQEVRRTLEFADRHRDEIAGIAFFTFSNQFDNSINLHVGGASAMPSVLKAIYDAAHADSPTAIQ